jgi:hypothetical protein
MTSGPSAAVAAAMAGSTPAKEQDPDSLKKLQYLGARARDLEQEIEDLKERLESKSAALLQLYTKDMVDLMQELKIGAINVMADGNKPSVDYSLAKVYGANIATAWPTDKREEGFVLVSKLGGAALIKTEVSVSFPMGGLKEAKKLAALAKKIKVTVPAKSKRGKPTKRAVDVEVIKSIPAGTLKAFLKDVYEEQKTILSDADLAKIGGYVGKVVKPREKKE